LDVFEVEPLPQKSPLLKMNNVLLAPHNANSSPAAWERVHWNTIRNLFEGLGINFTGEGV
jgi:D-3-phosphoglycerate dehydrogenase